MPNGGKGHLAAPGVSILKVSFPDSCRLKFHLGGLDSAQTHRWDKVDQLL